MLLQSSCRINFKEHTQTHIWICRVLASSCGSERSKSYANFSLTQGRFCFKEVFAHTQRPFIRKRQFTFRGPASNIIRRTVIHLIKWDYLFINLEGRYAKTRYQILPRHVPNLAPEVYRYLSLSLSLIVRFATRPLIY